MINNVASAINEIDLDNQVISIMDSADELSNIFNKIDEKVLELNHCLKTDTLQNILNEYSMIKENYKIIHDNILTYSEDLIQVKNNMKDGIKDITIKYKEITEELQVKKGGELNGIKY